jgi:hypothetical protein
VWGEGMVELLDTRIGVESRLRTVDPGHGASCVAARWRRRHPRAGARAGHRGRARGRGRPGARRRGRRHTGAPHAQRPAARGGDGAAACAGERRRAGRQHPGAHGPVGGLAPGAGRRGGGATSRGAHAHAASRAPRLPGGPIAPTPRRPVRGRRAIRACGGAGLDLRPGGAAVHVRALAAGHGRPAHRAGRAPGVARSRDARRARQPAAGAGSGDRLPGRTDGDRTPGRRRAAGAPGAGRPGRLGSARRPVSGRWRDRRAAGLDRARASRPRTGAGTRADAGHEPLGARRQSRRRPATPPRSDG